MDQDIPGGFLQNIPAIPAFRQEWQEWTGNELGMDQELEYKIHAISLFHYFWFIPGSFLRIP